MFWFQHCSSFWAVTGWVLLLHSPQFLIFVRHLGSVFQNMSSLQVWGQGGPRTFTCCHLGSLQFRCLWNEGRSTSVVGPSSLHSGWLLLRTALQTGREVLAQGWTPDHPPSPLESAAITLLKHGNVWCILQHRNITEMRNTNRAQWHEEKSLNLVENILCLQE